VIDQIEHQSHGQRTQQAGGKDDQGVIQEALAIGLGIQGDAQIAEVLAVRAAAGKFGAEALLLAEQAVGNPAA